MNYWFELIIFIFEPFIFNFYFQRLHHSILFLFLFNSWVINLTIPRFRVFSCLKFFILLEIYLLEYLFEGMDAILLVILYLFFKVKPSALNILQLHFLLYLMLVLTSMYVHKVGGKVISIEVFRVLREVLHNLCLLMKERLRILLLKNLIVILMCLPVKLLIIELILEATVIQFIRIFVIEVNLVLSIKAFLILLHLPKVDISIFSDIKVLIKPILVLQEALSSLIDSIPPKLITFLHL